MTLNLNDLMIFLESQFIQEQHAQAVSFRRLLHYWLLRWEQSIGIATAFGRDQHFIFTSAEYRPACVARSWVLGGQWVVTGGGVVTTCDHRPPYQHQHQPCNSLPSSARTRPIYEVPAPYTPNQGCFLPNWDVLSIPPFFCLARPRPGLFLPGFSV